MIKVNSFINNQLVLNQNLPLKRPSHLFRFLMVGCQWSLLINGNKTLFIDQLNTVCHGHRTQTKQAELRLVRNSQIDSGLLNLTAQPITAHFTPICVMKRKKQSDSHDSTTRKITFKFGYKFGDSWCQAQRENEDKDKRDQKLNHVILHVSLFNLRH